MTKKFNPKNVEQYFGTIVKTRNDSLYGLTKEGKFAGRPSIEGSELELIAGIDGDYYWNIFDCLHPEMPELKKELEKTILKYGEEIRPGLHLVVSLKPRCSKQKNRHGFISSRIETVYKI